MKVVWCCAVLLALFENVNLTPQHAAPRTSAVDRNPLLQQGEKIVHEENSPHQRTVVIKRKRDLPVSPFGSSGGSRGGGGGGGSQGSFQQQQSSGSRSNQGGGGGGFAGFSAQNQFSIGQKGNGFSNGFSPIQQLPNANLPVSSFRNQNVKGHGHGYQIGSSSAKSFSGGSGAARNAVHNTFPRENYNPPQGSSPGTIYTGNFPPGYSGGSAGGASSSYLPPPQPKSSPDSYSYPKPQSVYEPQPPATTYGVPEPSTSYGVPRSQPQSVYGVPQPESEEELPPEFVNGELFGKSMYTYIGKDGITRGVEGNVKFMATGKPKKLGISSAAAGSLAGGGLG